MKRTVSSERKKVVAEGREVKRYVASDFVPKRPTIAFSRRQLMRVWKGVRETNAKLSLKRSQIVSNFYLLENPNADLTLYGQTK